MYLRFWDDDRDVWELLYKELPKRSIKQEINILIGDIKVRMKKYKKKGKVKTVNKFFKVSVEQYIKDFLKLFPSESIGETAMIEEVYETIKLPKRSTSGSAGYDFFTPVDIHLEPNESITIPTGIKCQIEDRWFLSLYPRSGLGFKYQLHLATSVSIIDSDYYNNENNEGHIMAKLVNDGDKTVNIEKGSAFMQSVFLPYGITDDDNADGERKGGMGSTDKK